MLRALKSCRRKTFGSGVDGKLEEFINTLPKVMSFLMGLFGIQFFLTIIVAAFLQKFSPHMSLATWIVCNGLVRYMYPTDNELKQLIGKSQHLKSKGRRSDSSRKKESADGTSSVNLFNKLSEAFTVPCSINIDLKTAKIEETDMIFQYYYAEYKWLVDFALSAFVFNVIVELISLFFPATSKNDISLIPVWNFLVIFFSLKVLYSLTSAYWVGDDSGERSVCITFGVFFFVLAMAVLVIDESILEFNLDTGYELFSEEAVLFLKKQGISKEGGPAPVWIFKLILAILSALIGAFLGFPGMRMSNMFVDSLFTLRSKQLLMFLLYFNFFAPLFLILLWIKPLVREPLTGKHGGHETISDATFDNLRIVAILLCCFIRLLLTRIHLQSFLDMANQRVLKMKKEAGRISNLTLQKNISRVFYYLSAASLQYLAPTFLLFFLALTLRKTGTTEGESTSVLITRLQKSWLVSNVTVTTAQNLRHVFVPEFMRAIVSYFTWWTCVAMFLTSAFGVVYLQVFNG